MPSIIGMATWVYGSIALLLGGIFLALALRVNRQDARKPAIQLFAYSIAYLFAIFTALTLDRMFL